MKLAKQISKQILLELFQIEICIWHYFLVDCDQLDMGKKYAEVVVSSVFFSSQCQTQSIESISRTISLIVNLPTRWCHLNWIQIQPPRGATCIYFRFGHQVALFALVANLVFRWHQVHEFQVWPTDCTTSISCKFGHQVLALALEKKIGHQVVKLALVVQDSAISFIRWVSSSTKVISVKSNTHEGALHGDIQTQGLR